MENFNKNCMVIAKLSNENAVAGSLISNIFEISERSLFQCPDFLVTDINDKIHSAKLRVLHLYIISNDEVNTGDYFIDVKHNNALLRADNSQTIHSFCKKIVASTDTKCNVPGVSKEFISDFIKSWNKNNHIQKVNVEYEANGIIVVNDDNEVSVTAIKENYTKEEVIIILKKCWEDSRQNDKNEFPNFEEWININFPSNGHIFH